MTARLIIDLPNTEEVRAVLMRIASHVEDDMAEDLNLTVKDKAMDVAYEKVADALANALQHLVVDPKG